MGSYSICMVKHLFGNPVWIDLAMTGNFGNQLLMVLTIVVKTSNDELEWYSVPISFFRSISSGFDYGDN